jgi:hypothetical protein
MTRFSALFFIVVVFLPVTAHSECQPQAALSVLENTLSNKKFELPRGEIHLLAAMHPGDGKRRWSQDQFELLKKFAQRNLVILRETQAPIGSGGVTGWNQWNQAALTGVIGKYDLQAGPAMRDEASFTEKVDSFSITEGLYFSGKVVETQAYHGGGVNYCLVSALVLYRQRAALVWVLEELEGVRYSEERKVRALFKLDPFNKSWQLVAFDSANRDQDFKSQTVRYFISNSMLQSGIITKSSAGVSPPPTVPTPPAAPAAPATSSVEGAGLGGINLGMTKAAAEAAMGHDCERIEKDVKVDNGYICILKPFQSLIHGYIAWAFSSRGKVYSIQASLTAKLPNAEHLGQCRKGLADAMAGFPKQKLILARSEDRLPNTGTPGPVIVVLDHKYVFEGQPKHVSHDDLAPAFWFNCSNVSRYSPDPRDELFLTALLKDMRLY